MKIEIQIPAFTEKHKKAKESSPSLFLLAILNENHQQTRKLAAGCSKHCFEVAERADMV
ncbi:hypothetical protein SORDD17_00162 [Streptococcus oralis]|uniref:Uncharacterized protein n=1 Tax=Streptococcus oralis TaxID=1303 RepID=A0A139RPK6_STROR|nr:hypothetical protein [Streptococcus oralis]KXU16625.1 hypothetical protein SORDD17_00162 [Streptococcus oralis]